ncbi:TIGR02302 family protein [Methylobacterium gnaphalii]|uniref:TIGR02302 family protein n=1 Tax=Methylobacterium gnaphalii TaxID=1010610 RepID=A0A512JFS3_9HYPH|nr:TIGR02302 family protein [Methylobacterium gnaphalii]GEP08783.1 hypothetical protein MGN01_06280 [Methylobacterium gnaphalii]GLS47549.1 hypothetical protein GCM10007885_03930 [Methylobacterium gnaphalii]
MAEAETATSQTTRDPVRARLDRLVAGARAAGLIERIWPLVWRGVMVVLAFLTLSWLGLWLELPQVWRIAGLAAFVLLAVAALAPLVRLRALDRRQALARIDREAARSGRPGGALAHDPASAVEDTLAVGTNDPATKALWALHQRRAAAAVARLRVGAPRPDMPRHDPLALRAGFVVAAIAALFVAGPEWRERIGAAFDWREPPAPGPSFRVDGWIDPPLYTRLPPLIVTMSGTEAGKSAEQHLRAPVNSTLIVRIAGRGEATLTPNAVLQPIREDDKDDGARKPPAAGVNAKTAQSDLREERFRLGAGTAELKIKTEGAPSQSLTIESIPDRLPEVERVGGLDVNGRGTFNLTYRAKDDYGIASAEGIVEPLKPARSLVPVPKLNLALPPDATGASETKTLIDLTDNPWSGARMRLTLVVKDEAGQEGRTQPAEITLPARPFIQPLARSLAEERRRLVTAPDDDRKRVQTALDALLIAPEHFTPQPSIFLGLKTAAGRLRAATSDEDLIAVADLLWEMALKIEDGDLSDAEKSLRAAQDRLKEAMERGAPDEEIKKLTDDLKKALDRFMKEFAERQNKDQKNGQQKQSEQQQGKQKTVTPDQLQKMIQDMQEAMKRGDTAEAQRLLEQLRGILENLQSAQNGQKQGQQQSEMNKQMQELDRMSRDQQKLRDETFKESQEQQGRPRQNRQQQGQQQGQKGQQGQRGQGQQQEGQQGQNGGDSGKGDTGQQQQALRERLQELQRRMKEQGLEGEQGLSDAEQAMKEAEDALGRGQGDQAVDAQGRALDGLKKGAEGMQQQMQQQAEAEGQGQEGGENPGQQGQAGATDNDPLGRPTKGRDLSNGNVRVPNADESAVQRARRIMEELRRKLGDPTRPQEELDYFERLLRRN